MGRAVRKFFETVVKAVLIAAAALDIFTFVGLQLSPEAVGRTVCTIRPLGIIARPVVRQEWLGYVANQCAERPAEPAISIVTFLVKTSMGIVALAIFSVLYLADPAVRASLAKDLTNQRDRLGELKRTIFATAFFLALQAGSWPLLVVSPPERFGTSLISTLVDDCLIAMLLINIFITIAVAYYMLLLLLQTLKE